MSYNLACIALIDLPLLLLSIPHPKRRLKWIYDPVSGWANRRKRGKVAPEDQSAQNIMASVAQPTPPVEEQPLITASNPMIYRPHPRAIRQREGSGLKDETSQHHAQEGEARSVVIQIDDKKPSESAKLQEKPAAKPDLTTSIGNSKLPALMERMASNSSELGSTRDSGKLKYTPLPPIKRLQHSDSMPIRRNSLSGNSDELHIAQMPVHQRRKSSGMIGIPSSGSATQPLLARDSSASGKALKANELETSHATYTTGLSTQDALQASQTTASDASKKPGPAPIVHSEESPLLCYILDSHDFAVRAVGRAMLPLGLFASALNLWMVDPHDVDFGTGNVVLIAILVGQLGTVAYPWIDTGSCVLSIVALAFLRHVTAFSNLEQKVASFSLFLMVLIIQLPKAHASEAHRRYSFVRSKLVETQREILVKKQKQVDALLVECLPARVVRALRAADYGRGYSELSKRFENATCMFMEITTPWNSAIDEEDESSVDSDGILTKSLGTSSFSDTSKLREVVETLNSFFDEFDAIHSAFKTVEKIKVIGGTKILYCSGIELEIDPDHGTADVLRLALRFRDLFEEQCELVSSIIGSFRFSIRMGIYRGIIGKNNIVYDVIGDCVNCSSRLVWEFNFTCLGTRDIKGKGTMMLHSLDGEANSNAQVAAGTIADNFAASMIGSIGDHGLGLKTSPSALTALRQRANIPAVQIAPGRARMRRTSIERYYEQVSALDGFKEIYDSFLKSMPRDFQAAMGAVATSLPHDVERILARICIKKEANTSFEVMMARSAHTLINLRTLNFLSSEFEMLYRQYSAVTFASEFRTDMQLALVMYLLYLACAIVNIAFTDANWIRPSSLTAKLASVIVIMFLHFCAFMTWNAQFSRKLAESHEVTSATGSHNSLAFSISAVDSHETVQRNFDLFKHTLGIFFAVTLLFCIFFSLIVTWGDLGREYTNYELNLAATWLFWTSLFNFVPLPTLAAWNLLLLVASQLWLAFYGFPVLAPSDQPGGLPKYFELDVWLMLGAFVINTCAAYLRHRKMRFDFLLTLVSHQQKKLVEGEFARSERVLATLFPPRIATRLKHFHGTYVEQHQTACVLSTDVVGYTSLSSILHPVDVIEILNDMFTHFDNLCELHSIEKVSTAGDGFVAFGFCERSPDGEASDDAIAEMVFRVCRVAMAIQSTIMGFVNRKCEKQLRGQKLALRAGVNAGPLSGGVIGGSRRFKFEIFGVTLELADFVQANCQTGSVHITELTYSLAKSHFEKNNILVSDAGEIDFQGVPVKRFAIAVPE
nr:hypothetical protein HK105_001846 [Polyrhizophydium stewartii]